MAIFNKNNQELMQDNKTLFETVVVADQYGTPAGSHGMGAATNYTAFGEVSTASINPVIQLDGIYGLDPEKFQTYSAFGGSVGTNGPLMECSTGTSFGYGVIRSRRVLRYRPGQGANARFTAMFSPGTTGYIQRAGLFTQEQALQVGFQDDQFGVIRQTGGKAVIYQLGVSAAASGAETVTVTLNDTVFNINVTAGTIQQNVTTIGNEAFAGWVVEYNGDDVRFLSEAVGPMTGAFSVSSTGTFAGTMTELQAGVAHTIHFTPQSEFNLDPLDGTGPSGVVLDPTKLNVFQINFRWLGAGEIKWAIENSLNGDMIFFHHTHYSNQNTTVHVDNPTFKIGYVAASLGGTGTDIKVSGASMMAAIEGKINTTSLPQSTAASRSSMNNADTEYHMLSLKNRLILNNKINTREIILKSISAGMVSAASVPAIVKIYFDKDMVLDLQYNAINDTWSSAYVSKTATTHTNTTDSPVYQFVVAPGSVETIDLEDLRLVLPPNSKASVVVVSSGNMSQADVALTWIED